MALFMLRQKDFVNAPPDAVFGMVVRAKNEEDARFLAQRNENIHRDGEQYWSSEYAKCEVIDYDGDSEVILVS